MPRATTRQASKSSQQPRRSQRASQSQPERDDDEMDDQQQEDEDEADEDRMEVDDDGGDSNNEIERKGSALVRLALSTEVKRIPLKRDEINKKVLGSNTRAFNRVFENAQRKLSKAFGMELVELRTRAELAKDHLNGGQAQEDQEAPAGKTKAAATGSKTYILRSVLHPALIERASAISEHILEEEAAEELSDEDDDATRSYGTILSWNSDQLGPIGILYVILSLILVNGRVISDGDLRKHLKKLRLHGSSRLHFTARSTRESQSIDDYLTALIKQGYIDRHQVGETKKKAGAKRVRAQEEDDANKYEWRWGNRAEAEIGERALAEFVADFMVGEQQDDDDDDNGRRNARAQKESPFEKMMAGISKAAGGTLAELKV